MTRSSGLSADDVLCTCEGITRGDLHYYFSNSDASLDDFIADTKYGTRCTACMLALDVELESLSIKSAREVSSNFSTFSSKKSKFMRSVELVESGFFLNLEDVKTKLVISNCKNQFIDKSENNLVEYEYKLKVYEDSGTIIKRSTGKIPVLGRMEYDFGLQDSYRNGWFWLLLVPKGCGYFGSIRPQVCLQHNNWISTVHTQPHGSSCRKKSVLVKRLNGVFNSFVHIINSSTKVKNEINFQLSVTSRHKECAVTSKKIDLAPNSSRLISIDEIFCGNKMEDCLYTLTVNSSEIARKHILIRQSDGSFSIDHFPNNR